jgi:hypothetical protein
MDIEMTADPDDKERHSDTLPLGLFQSYFAWDSAFPK